MLLSLDAQFLIFFVLIYCNINVVPSNPCVGPRIKIYFTLLSTCTDELISAPKIMTYFPELQSANENSERESNPML